MKLLRWTAFAILLCCLTSCVCQRGDAPSFSPAQIADRARPATVAIVTQFEVTGTVPRMQLDTDKLEQLMSRHDYRASRKHWRLS